MKDHITTRQSFQTLYPDLNGHYLELRRLPMVVQNFCRTVDEAATIAAADRTRNVYFGVVPRSGPKGDEDHAALMPALWLDFDWKHFKSRQEAGKVLAAFEYPPSIETETGGGWQPLWLLKEPEPVTDQSKPYLRGLLWGLADSFGLDHVHDLAQLMRVPGTLHAKNGKGETVFVKDCPTPKMARVVSWHPERWYNLSDFEPYQVKDQPGGNGKAPSARVGERIPEGKRNGTLASLAGTMRRRGVDEAAITAALLAENVPKCDPPLSEKEVREIARSIGRYAPGEKTT